MKRRPWSQHPRILAARSRSRATEVAVRMAEGYRLHSTNRNAAVIAHYGFISIFPLFLVFTTVLGFLLQGNESMQANIVDSALAQLPIIGNTLATSPEELKGSIVALGLGLAIALWSGTKAFLAMQAALDDIHEIDLDDRLSFVAARLRALAAILIVGVALVSSTFITVEVGNSDYILVGKLMLLIAAAVVNGLVAAASYRWLCSTPSTWRDVAPGAATTGVAFAVLQLLGSTLVTRWITNAESVYGSLGAVIALFAWLGFHATAGLLGAELNRALLSTRPLPAEGLRAGGVATPPTA
ncbi:MAG: YihY/virulence factor BrkB family protein [Ilumatobacteraceae bacterium]